MTTLRLITVVDAIATGDLAVTAGLEDSGTPTTNGANLQAAINAAAAGDTLVLESGVTYFRTAGFTLPAHAGSAPITLTASRQSLGPAPGQRIDPAVHAPALATLTSSQGAATLSVTAGAAYWTCSLLDVTFEGTSYSPALVITADNGTGTGGVPTYAEVLATHDLLLDRLWIHPPECTAADLHPTKTTGFVMHAGRGIHLTGVDIAVTNSWIGEFVGCFPGAFRDPPVADGTPCSADGGGLIDSYGIYGFLGGPFLIQNNRIEAFFNNLFPTASEVDPGHLASMSAPGLTSATFSVTTDISAGTLVAVEVPEGTDSCVTNASNPKCYQTVEIDTVNHATGAVTYHAFGTGGLTVTPITGGRAQWTGLQPHDVTITKNHLWKDFAWGDLWPGGAKCYIEVKTCLDCTYTGNRFEGACDASFGLEVAQSGSVLASNGGSPWNTVRNQIIRDNLFLGDVYGMFIPLYGAQPSGSFKVSNAIGGNILIENNLWLNVPLACGGNATTSGMFQTSSGHDVTIQHNTILFERSSGGPQALIYASSGTCYDNSVPGYLEGVPTVPCGQHVFTFKDNIASFGQFGWNPNGPPGGSYANYRIGQSYAWPDPTVGSGGPHRANNVIIEDPEVSVNTPGTEDQFPIAAVNPLSESPFNVTSYGAVGFVDQTTCLDGSAWQNCGLAPSSDYAGQATDATDPGVDIAALAAAL